MAPRPSRVGHDKRLIRPGAFQAAVSARGEPPWRRATYSRAGRRSVSVEKIIPTSYWRSTAPATKSIASATSIPFSCGLTVCHSGGYRSGRATTGHLQPARQHTGACARHTHVAVSPNRVVRCIPEPPTTADRRSYRREHKADGRRRSGRFDHARDARARVRRQTSPEHRDTRSVRQ